MDYNSTLQWLQGLLGTQQNTNASQFTQGLTTQQQESAASLAAQQAMQAAGLTSASQMQGASLGEQGREFDATTALNKVIADWQNQLATTGQTQQYGLQQNAQQFGQDFTKQQYADTRNGMTVGQLADAYNTSPAVLASQAATQAAIQKIIQDRISANSNTSQQFPTQYGASLVPFQNYGVSGPLSLGLRSNQPTAKTTLSAGS